MDAIRKLNDEYFGGHYQQTFLIDSHDPRNIDVAILSTLPIVEMRSHIDDGDDEAVRPDRP